MWPLSQSTQGETCLSEFQDSNHYKVWYWQNDKVDTGRMQWMQQEYQKSGAQYLFNLLRRQKTNFRTSVTFLVYVSLCNPEDNKQGLSNTHMYDIHISAIHLNFYIQWREAGILRYESSGPFYTSNLG